MKKLALFILFISTLSFAQGVRYDIPPILGPRGNPLPNVQVSLCSGTATITGSTCNSPTQSFTDITLVTLCSVGLPVTLANSANCQGTSDPSGNAGFWLSPGAYIYCLTGPQINGQCYNLTVPAGVTASGTPTLPSLTVSGAVTANGTLNGAVNCSVQAGATFGAKLSAAITAAGAGGFVDCRNSTGAQTLSSDITISNPITIYLGCETLITASARILISAGTTGVHIVGCSPYGAKTSTNGTWVSYTGSDYFLKFGDSTASTDRNSVKDVAISIGATAVGAIFVGRSQFNEFRRVTLAGASTNSFCFNSDGTGGFSSNTILYAPIISGCHIGAQFTGTGSAGNNSNQLIAGTVQASGKADTGSIAVNIASGDSNEIIGTDLENADIGLQIANSRNVSPLVRFEVSTINTHVKFIGGSSDNTVHTINAPNSLTISDAGTANTNSVTSPGAFSVTNGGNAYGFRNEADAALAINIIAGVAADQNKDIIYKDRTQTSKVLLRTDSSSNFSIITTATAAPFLTTQAGATAVRANGLNAVQINDATNSGTGGLTINSGGASPAANWTTDGTGLTAKYRGVSTAGNGVASVYGATTQKTETAADTNVLTFTPPAAAGTYRLSVVLSLSAANAATLGWTATWTDSNGNAQTPTNLSLFQDGTAGPALTFTTSAAGNYYGEALIDINSAATNIVIKLTFSGTSFTGKMSAAIERVI